METELARALEPRLSLLGLGRPGEHVGAGRVASDDEHWQSVFIDLASRAIAILIVPGSTKGTRWELDRINQDEILREKTFLIIPPLLINQYGLFRRETIYGHHEREDALAELAARRISFNDIDNPRGLLISYSATSEVRAVPLLTYETPRLERGLFGFIFTHNSQRKSLVMTLGLRNVICSISPELAASIRR